MLATLRAELIRADLRARTSPTEDERKEWRAYAAQLRAELRARTRPTH